MARRRRVNSNQLGLALSFYVKERDNLPVPAFGDFNEELLEAAVDSIELPPKPKDYRDNAEIAKYNEKLKWNELGEPTRARIQSVIHTSPAVERFITAKTKIEGQQDFYPRLLSLFQIEYNRLVKDEGLGGDALFEGIERAISSRIQNIKARGAALPILTHLFLICDLFLREDPNAVSN